MENVVNDLNTAKLILCNPQMLTPEMCIRIGQAITSAIAMLEKQVPIPVKDVQWHEVTRKRMINGICPSCNSIITHFNGSGFCDKCGQAVKWE